MVMLVMAMCNIYTMLYDAVLSARNRNRCDEFAERCHAVALRALIFASVAWVETSSGLGVIGKTAGSRRPGFADLWYI